MCGFGADDGSHTQQFSVAEIKKEKPTGLTGGL